MRRRDLAGFFAIGLLVVGLQFAARGAQAQQDPLLGLHNCEAYYPKSQWFKKCAPYCYGILNNAGYLPPECEGWINGPPRATSSRHCTPRVVHQYENQITYTQTKIEDLWGEIKSKAIVLGISLIAFEVEIPLWVGCLVKASHLNEANELNELWERYNNDKYTYLPQLWAKFRDQCPLDYRSWEDSMTVRGWREQQKQRELKQALQACPAISRAPQPPSNSAENTECYTLSQQVCSYERNHQVIPDGLRQQFYACVERVNRTAKSPIRLAC